MEMNMTFRLGDMLLPVPPMLDMLIIAMGRLLPAIDMNMLLPELPMVDMLLSDMDMSLPEPGGYAHHSHGYGYAPPGYRYG